MDSLALERLFRRVQMLFGRGRVTGVNDSGTIQVMQVKMNARETGDNRYRVAEFGFTSVPPDGSDALVMSVAGDRGVGAVVGTNHQASRPTGLQSGESMLYSEDGKQIYMTADGGIVVNAKGQNVVVNNAANVTWNCSGDFTLQLGGKFKVVAPGGSSFETPTLSATGDIQDNSVSNAETMKTMRATYDVHEHEVPSIQTGLSTATTNPPIQQE